MSSLSQIRKQRRLAINAQGFELNPPRCLNCRHYGPPMHGVPSTLLTKPKAYRPRTCALGSFQVMPWSICDRWTGANGETLEAAAA